MYLRAMKTIEILSKLESVKFTADQARTIAEIIEERNSELATKDHVDAIVTKAKYDLVKWIVGGIIANVLVATLLKFLG